MILENLIIQLDYLDMILMINAFLRMEWSRIFLQDKHYINNEIIHFTK